MHWSLFILHVHGRGGCVSVGATHIKKELARADMAYRTRSNFATELAFTHICDSDLAANPLA